jgi:hypothetical protein
MMQRHARGTYLPSMKVSHLLHDLMFGLLLFILNRLYFRKVSSEELSLTNSSLKSPQHTGQRRCRSPSPTFTSMFRRTQFLHTILPTSASRASQ